MADSERVRRLHAQMVRLRAELSGVETGVLPVVEERSQVTAQEVAETLGKTVQNANNGLKKLLRAGLIIREQRDRPGGGREFVYTRADDEEAGERG